jgi:hypothetical protein
MPQTMSVSERIKIRCPCCHQRLCDRLHTDDGWFLEHRHTKRLSIVCKESWVVKCLQCQSTYRIAPREGILETYRPEHYDNGIQTQNPAD